MTDGALPALQVDELVSGYGEVRILDGVSITLAQDEIVTIIGPNGAGKSTLLKAVFGLIPTFEGKVSLAGTDVTGVRTDRLCQRGIGFVPQTNNVFSTLTVRENLEMGGYIREDAVEERIEWVLTMFPALSGRMSERAGRLSGGQRQMVAIGRALMLDPAVLMLDEPSASLAPNLVDQVFEKTVEIRNRGTAVLIVEQNARQALSISDRGYVLAAGRNRFEGPAQSLLDTDDVRRLYLGG